MNVPPENGSVVKFPSAVGVAKGEHHVFVGNAVMGYLAAQGQMLLKHRKATYLYSGKVWELRIDIDDWLDGEIENACERLGLTNTNKLTMEVRKRILRRIGRDQPVPWDQHGKIPVRNGLVDPITGELQPARPEHFCTWRVDVDYDPEATCPWWETMIADMFGDKKPDERDELVNVVQEVVGCALIDRKPRGLSKGLVFWGIQNLGKSGPLDVVTGLFGGEPIAVSIASIEGTHGLMPFTKRLPWVLHEAFSGQWHFSSIVKAIITQEPVSINVKNGPILTQVIRSPIFWATNFQPQFKEATRAIVSRLIVIEVSRHFDDANPVGAAREAIQRGYAKPGDFIVATELPGVLNWAIAGLRRALERGSIKQPDSVKATADAIHRDSNLVAGFLEECVEYDPMARVRVSDFCLAHAAWWLELKGEDCKLPTNEAISKAVKAVGDGRIGRDAKEMRDSLSHYYCGIVLNEVGLRYHKVAYESAIFEGKKPTATNPAEEVNSLIPSTWDDRESIIKMRSCHPDVSPTTDRVTETG